MLSLSYWRTACRNQQTNFTGQRCRLRILKVLVLQTCDVETWLWAGLALWETCGISSCRSTSCKMIGQISCHVSQRQKNSPPATQWPWTTTIYHQFSRTWVPFRNDGLLQELATFVPRTSPGNQASFCRLAERYAFLVLCNRYASIFREK